MHLYRSILSVLIAAVFLTLAAAAQTKRPASTVTKKPLVTSVAPTPSPSPAEPVVVKSEPKKNERPVTEHGAVKGTLASKAAAPTYFYEFAQPDFVISKIVIEHDDAGRGTVTFIKKMFGDGVTDPLQVSSAALERINNAFAAL